MQSIEYVQITLKPWSYPNQAEKIIEITLRVNGTEHHFRRPLPINDFDSVFDQIMEMAKDHFRKVVRGKLDEMEI